MRVYRSNNCIYCVLDWLVIGVSLTHPGGKVGRLVAILSAELLAQLAEHWGSNPRSLVQAR